MRGVALCWDRIRIVDLGLLTNATLARAGYAALGQVLEAERPDVIGTHSGWSEYSHIYELPWFQDHYAPLLAKRTLLWVRRDRLLALSAARPEALSQRPLGELPAGTLYAGGPIDTAFREARRGEALVVLRTQ